MEGVESVFDGETYEIRSKNERLRQELAEFMAVCYISKKIDFPKEDNLKLKKD